MIMHNTPAVNFTIFANFRIDTEERFLRMKDSFNSISKTNIHEIVVNIRGEFKFETAFFLKESFTGLLHISHLESKAGWFYDSRILFNKITSDVVFFWIEDHICTVKPCVFNEVITSFSSNSLDYLEYSWFNSEISHELSLIAEYSTKYFSIIDLNSKSNRLKNLIYERSIGRKPYLVSCPSIYSKPFFERILKLNRPLLPRWPRSTPFDFEKRSDDTYVLPFRYGFLKIELLACIDDDNMFKDSSLVSRGLYPERIDRTLSVSNRNSKDGIKVVVKTGNIVNLLKFKFNNLVKRVGFFLNW